MWASEAWRNHTKALTKITELYIYIYMCIYIYRERERERERVLGDSLNFKRSRVKNLCSEFKIERFRLEDNLELRLPSPNKYETHEVLLALTVVFAGPFCVEPGVGSFHTRGWLYTVHCTRAAGLRPLQVTTQQLIVGIAGMPFCVPLNPKP